MLEILVFDYAIKVWEALAVIGIFLAVFEIFAPGFILLPIGLAFLATAGIAVFLSTWLSILIALAASLCFLIWLFKFKLDLGASTSSAVGTNVDGMVGEEVIVTEALSSENEVGEVKLYGDRWRAYSISNRDYAVGDKAVVVKVDGNKLALD